MNADKFPWLALGMGLTLMLILVAAGALQSDQETLLPLLTLLIMNEFGFVVTLIGTVQSVRRLLRSGIQLQTLVISLGCGALALAFLLLGVSLWPGMGGVAVT